MFMEVIILSYCISLDQNSTFTPVANSIDTPLIKNTHYYTTTLIPIPYFVESTASGLSIMPMETLNIHHMASVSESVAVYTTLNSNTNHEDSDPSFTQPMPSDSG